MLMQPIAGITLYENVPRVFVPMLWFEQRVQIPDSEVFKLKMLLNLSIICTSLGILLMVIGLIVSSCLVYKICTTNICGKKENKYLYSEQNIPLKGERSVEIVKRI
jgi:hypothetical protein